MPAGHIYVVQYCNMADLTDTPNWCSTTPYQDENGHAVGEVLFVWVDCKTNAVLPLSQQPPAYQYPGVSTGLKQS